MLPEGWRALPLADVCELVNGRGFKPHEWDTEGLPIIRIQNLNGGGDFNYFKGSFDPKILVTNGQLLFAWSGSRGTSFGPHVWRGGEAVLNYHTWKVLPKKGIDQEFLFNLLRHITTKIEASAHGASALVHTQKWDMEKRVLTLPPLPEQKKIADILSTWDAAIETTGKLLANAEAQKRALMQQLLTGKRRLKGFEGREWRIAPISSIAQEVSERNKSAGDLPVISCSKTVGFVNSLEYFKKQVFSDDLSSYKVIKRNQIGYPSNHIEEGSIGHQTLHDVALVSPIYTIFETTRAMDAAFLFRVLKTDLYRQAFAAATNGSVDRRGSLRWKAFSLIRVPVPKLDEQKAIMSVIEPAIREEQLVRQSLSHLQSEKRALMQQLLTGKRRVTV